MSRYFIDRASKSMVFIYAAIVSLLLAVLLGVACAIFLIREIFRPMVELLVGIPSVRLTNRLYEAVTPAWLCPSGG